MLDNETKRRIDSARDILVGKVPDPKSQVEQITIALIYKFMDDMDAEAEEMGGKRSFFTGEYEKFGWARLMSPALSGYELLSLYSEAIERMTRNEDLPQLFRDIFKNAYLPYRDPETLKLFIKTINEFHYDHSERLGDAFEYLLSVLGSQGEAGQFRTPRHIIDFMVKVVDPQKDDRILDPACGTAGFLISAYKHILAANAKDGRQGALLNPDERNRLAENLNGYDISPDMVRLSRVNLYLHGFVEPHIHEYDTLTSEENWNEYADVILANPPFMSPKGGIRPHKRFSVQSNRSEVLFVDYMAEHLTLNGRAGIIVPEGIIFQSAGAYKQLRKYLIEKNYLWAVVSLPAGVFNPYSGVKTSILFLDRTLSKKTDNILFVKVEKDGYDLGAQRRPLCNENKDKPEWCPKHSDFNNALNTLKTWQKAVNEGKQDEFVLSSDSSSLVPIAKLAENDDYNLTADRYRVLQNKLKQKWLMIKLEDLLDYEQPTEYIVKSVDYDDEYKTPVLTAGKSFILGYTNEKDGIFPIEKLPVIIFDDFTTATKFVDFPFKVKSSAMKILKAKGDVTDIRYIYYVIKKIEFNASTHKRYWISEYSKLQIPLPPLEVQRQIMEEIAGYERIIDGARQVVEVWKPDIELELEDSLQEGREEWEKVELGTICSFIRGPFGGSLKKEIFVKDGYLVYEQYHAINNDFNFGRYFIDENKFHEMKRFEVFAGDLLISCSGTMGKVAIVPNDFRQGIINQALLKLTPMTERINALFLKYVLESNEIQNRYFRNQSGVAIQNVSSVSTLKNMRISLPPLTIQNQIISRLEYEHSIIDGNKKLIELFEEKTKKVIGKVWEG